MRVGSLFSGVGGFDLGLECAGMDVAWQVENDRFCRQVLRARWPDVNLYGDVNDVGPDQLSDVDLICGGFPCQDLSVAGNREGLDGERSGLWHEFLRIADSVAPHWVLIENVPGLLSSNDGEDFAVLLGGLTGFHPEVPDGGWEDGGYCEGPKRRAFWRVLDTQHFGPPQRRRRVFIVADSRARCGPEVLLEPESVPWDSASGRRAGEGTSKRTGNGTSKACGDTGGIATTLDGHYHKGPGGRGNKERQVVAFNATQDPISEEEKNPALSDQGAAIDRPAPRRLTPKETERLQGFSPGWTAEGVDADGEPTEISDTQRYKQMGNAVSVPVAAWIGSRIVAQEVNRDKP